MSATKTPVNAISFNKEVVADAFDKGVNAILTKSDIDAN